MFGGYAYTYAVKGDVAMTSDQAAYLTSVYWVSSCFIQNLFCYGLQLKQIEGKTLY